MINKIIMKVNGNWYFTELDTSFFGTLIKENSTIKLNIIGQLPYSNASARFPIVYGKTVEGDFTLLNCIWNGSYSYNHESKISESSLFCISVIRGNCFKNSNELLFNQFKFNFDGLKEWANLQNLNTDFSHKKVRAEYENPNPIEFNINNQIYGSLIFEFDDFTERKSDAVHQINQYVYIQLKSQTELDYELYLKNKEVLIHFFYFAINYKIQPYIQRLFKYNLQQSKRVKELVYIQPQNSEINNFPERHQFPFKFKDIENEFNDILTNWFCIYEKLTPIINIWYNFLTNDKLSIENKFILTCQVLETFHTRFKQKNETYIEGECSKHDKNPYFATRIKKLIDFLRKNISDNIFKDFNELDVLSKLIKETRNYYTHYDEKLNKWNKNELLKYTPELINMLHILVLFEIGIKPNILKKFHENNHFAYYSDINDIPIFNQKKC